jgi:TonB family protein
VRRDFALVLVALLLPAFAAGQETAEPTPRPALAQPAKVPVHYAGPGVIAPILYPQSVSISSPRHCNAINGVVEFSALVDENGLPRSMQIVRSDDARLNNFAIELVAAQRFKPGTFNGIPAAVAISLKAALHTCALPMKKKSAQEDAVLNLTSHPFFEIAIAAAPSAPPEAAIPAPAVSISTSSAANQPASKISAPVPIFQPNPQYSKAARREKITGSCLIGATIDANGVPENVRVVTSLEPSLDHNSVEAIKTWRFNPALQDSSVPVPFEVTIVVTFWRQDTMFLSFTTIEPKPSSAIVSSTTGDAAKDITPPVPLNADEVQAEYSAYGRLAQISGVCVVAFIVDTNGVPQNVRVVRSLESSMDENVVAAVDELRFKPALKDGTTPVPVEVIMPFSFKFKLPRRELIETALTAAIFLFGI